MIFAVEGIVGDVVPWAGAGGIIGVVAFALKLLVNFQKDFTDRYAGEVRRQEADIVRLRADLEVQARDHAKELEDLRVDHRSQMSAERDHREQCERSLDAQGRLLEQLQMRLESLDRRKYPPT